MKGVIENCSDLVIIISVQGILNEVWKNKLIFVETPDANETSIALENYRRASRIFLSSFHTFIGYPCRLAIMAEVQCYYLSPEEKYQKESILIIIMAGLS